MTRVTFGVSASSFIANMCIKQNAINFESQFPNAAKEVQKSFYVDDYLGGADSTEQAIRLQEEMCSLFQMGGFLLRKWNCSDAKVLQSISPELRDSRRVITLSDSEQYTKTLGIEWNPQDDHFRVCIVDLPRVHQMTKRSLVSDVAKIFDALGWFSPTIIKAKILLQSLWSAKIGWDDLVPDNIVEEWSKWRSQLPMLSNHHVPRCYYPKGANITSAQLHGFSDASEKAYSGVVYLRLEDSNGAVYTSLVISKTRVAPIKRQTIPRLELCGALTLAHLLAHSKSVLEMPMDSIHAWTDSTIVLSWIQGNPHRFKVYVGNRVSQILDLTPADRWNHVVSEDNPADCTSRGIFPSELLSHEQWWNGPHWLKLPAHQWPKTSKSQPSDVMEECGELRSIVCNVSTIQDPLISFDRFSSFNHYKRVIAWVIRFIDNCRAKTKGLKPDNGPLTIEELEQSARYWFSTIQASHFSRELDLLKGSPHGTEAIDKASTDADRGSPIPSSSTLSALQPFLDAKGLLRVGGRQQNAKFTYSSRHPIILHSKHPLVKILIRSEHMRLFHGGSLVVSSSLFRDFHIVGGHGAIRSIVRNCITCRRRAPRPKPQMMGQLPLERVTPDAVFDHVGLDYAGPLYLKLGSVRKPTIIKSYVCFCVHVC